MSAYEIEEATAVKEAVRVREMKRRVGAAITLSCELRADLAAAVAAWIREQYLTGWPGMVSEKTGKECWLTSFVQEVATDDQIEAAELERWFEPGRVEERNGCEAIQVAVMPQECLRHGMVIAGGDICTALLQHETGEADPAADFENVFACDGKLAHLFRERQPSGPDDTEERPGGGTDPCPFRAAVGIGELLPVAQRTNVKRHRSDLIPGRLNLVT